MQILQGVLLSALGIAMALGLAEGLLRLFPRLLPEDAGLRIHWREVVETTTTISTGDPYLGFVYPPHYDGEVQLGEVHFRYSTDEKGFRNAGPWPEGADIVTVGDSLTFSFGVDDDEAWVARVAAELPGKEVLNLGMIGAAPQQYWRYYERFGDPQHPRLLIFGLFPGNDLRDAELFDLWLAAGAEGNYDVWRFFKGRVPGASRGWQSFFEKSYLLTSLAAWKNSLSSPFSSRTVGFPDGTRLRLAAGVRAQSAARANPDNPVFRRVVELMAEVKEQCDKDGTALLVLLFPTKEEVYLPLSGQPAPLSVEPFLVELERLGITHLNLTPHFQDRARQGSRLFFEIDGHPNREGYRVVADVVLAYLHQNSDLFEQPD